jgi:hypothetical protein
MRDSNPNKGNVVGFLSHLDRLENLTKKKSHAKGKKCKVCGVGIKAHFAYCYDCFTLSKSSGSKLSSKPKREPKAWEGVVKKLPTIKPDPETFMKVPRATRDRRIMK